MTKSNGGAAITDTSALCKLAMTPPSPLTAQRHFLPLYVTL